MTSNKGKVCPFCGLNGDPTGSHDDDLGFELCDKCEAERGVSSVRDTLVDDLRKLGETPHGRYESAKLNLMEDSWKHENTDPSEKALDKAVSNWIDERVGHAVIGLVFFMLIVVGLRIVGGWILS